MRKLQALHSCQRQCPLYGTHAGKLNEGADPAKLRMLQPVNLIYSVEYRTKTQESAAMVGQPFKIGRL